MNLSLKNIQTNLSTIAIFNDLFENVFVRTGVIDLSHQGSCAAELWPVPAPPGEAASS